MRNNVFPDTISLWGEGGCFTTVLSDLYRTPGSFLTETELATDALPVYECTVIGRDEWR